ncbi:MAG: hypothetical protein J1F03_07450 [Oscillospiraceae bacterium]|nr:hypothetical protein [Oscillospiraceae bacterium]
MLIVIGDTNAPSLFGKIFPETELVRARGDVEISAPDAVVIAKTKAFEVLNAFGVIVGENAEVNTPRGVQLIVCGNSPKNTVSMTSRTSDKITLALNRAVKTQNGICEPLELPVDLLGGFSEFDYMSAFAGAILLHGKPF